MHLVTETMRTVRVGGRALFYAWAKEQEGGGEDGSGSEGGGGGGGGGCGGGGGGGGGGGSSRSGHRFATPDVLVPFHLRLPGGEGKKKKGSRAGVRRKRGEAPSRTGGSADGTDGGDGGSGIKAAAAEAAAAEAEVTSEAEVTAEEEAAAEVAPPAGASRIDTVKKTAIFQVSRG